MSRVSLSIPALAAAFALVVGCQSVERNPPLPGGGGVGGGSGVPGDGGINPGDDAGTAGLVSGRVCILIDLRVPTVCEQIDASRYQVTDRATGASVLTDSVGDFSLPVDAIAQVDLVIDTDTADVEIVPALVPIPLIDGSREGVIVPVYALQDFEDLKAELTLTAEPEVGTSTLVVHVFDGGQSANLIDLRDPIGSDVFYDDPNDPAEWAPNGVTGALGAIMTLGVDPSANSVLIGRDADQLLVEPVPFAPDRMTFAEIEFGQAAGRASK